MSKTQTDNNDSAIQINEDDDIDKKILIRKKYGGYRGYDGHFSHCDGSKSKWHTEIPCKSCLKFLKM